MKKKSFVFLVVSILIPIAAQAIGTVNANYVEVIRSVASTKWLPLITVATLKIFTILWLFDTLRTAVFEQLITGGAKKIFAFLVVRICFFGFFSTCLLHPEFYSGLLRFFTDIGRQAFKFEGSIDHNSIMGIDAGWLFHQYETWYISTYVPNMNDLQLTQLGTQVGYAILSIIYLLCTIFIAFMVIVLEVQIYCALYGGLILTSFAGSSWTYSIWGNYLNMIIGLGIRIMIFCMLFGVMQAVLYVPPQEADLMSSVITCILATLCLGFIPTYIAGLVSGHASRGFAPQVVGSALGAYALGKGMLGAGANTTNAVTKLGDKVGLNKAGLSKVGEHIKKSWNKGASKPSSGTSNKSDKIDFMFKDGKKK